MKPIIGITSPVSDGDYKVRTEYAEAVYKAGGMPVILPYTDDITLIAETLDGILFTGGGDIMPKLYGEEPRPETSGICESRDEFEFALCKEAIARNKPILCICRGMQLLNICLGGTLEQHIENHQYKRDDDFLHDIEINKSSTLHRILGNSVKVNSRHHQAIGKTGPEIIVCAHAPDGTPEAIEAPGLKFAIGVQWHPEDIVKSHPSQLKLFEALVAASANV